MDYEILANIIYGVAAMVVYALLTFVILKHRYKFQKAFFKIFVVGFVMNLTCYASSFLTMRIPQHTDVNGTFYAFFTSLSMNNTETSFPLNFFHMLHFEFAFTQYIFNFLICLNRFTSVYWHQKDEKYWNRYLWLIVIAMFVLPFLASTRHILFNHSFFEWNVITQRYSIDSFYTKKSIYTILTPFLIFVTALNVFLNVATGLKIYNFKKQNPGVKVHGMSLFKVSFAGFIMEIFLAILTMIALWLHTDADMTTSSSWTLHRICSKLMPYASDVLTLTQPFLVLMFSKKARLVFCQEFKVLRGFQKAKIIEESKTEAAITDTKLAH